MKNKTLSSRLAFGFGLCVILSILLATYAALRMNSLAVAVNEVATNRLIKISQLQQLRNNLNAQGHQVRNILISRDQTFRDGELKKAQNIKNLNKQIIDSLIGTISPQSARDLIGSVSDLIGPFNDALDKTVALAYKGDIDAANKQLIGEMRDRQMPLFKAVDDSLLLQMDLSENLSKQSTDKAASGVHSMIELTLAIALVSGFAGWLITRDLVRSLGAEPDELRQAAHNCATGNLIPVRGADTAPLGSVLASLGTMQTSLLQIVSQVRQGSESVSNASSEIVQGNADLSARTENQASALQEAAASMEELGSTVKQNADNALKASQLSQSASGIAIKGGVVVSKVVEAMKEINESSKKISDIISLIDGIAFQTNILSLNAAVEAARAGPQGRGFAVVAGEVRSLAKRSAEAASEIKALITVSVSRVEQGSALVDEAGTTMQEVVSSIKTVTHLMSEISTASNEQSSSVSQVGQAVVQIDRATHQNATLVDQMAAAANSLEGQAKQLVEVVSVFKT